MPQYSRASAFEAVRTYRARTATTRQGVTEWVIMHDICGTIICLAYARELQHVPIADAPAADWQLH